MESLAWKCVHEEGKPSCGSSECFTVSLYNESFLVCKCITNTTTARFYVPTMHLPHERPPTQYLPLELSRHFVYIIFLSRIVGNFSDANMQSVRLGDISWRFLGDDQGWLYNDKAPSFEMHNDFNRWSADINLQHASPVSTCYVLPFSFFTAL